MKPLKDDIFFSRLLQFSLLGTLLLLLVLLFTEYTFFGPDTITLSSPGTEALEQHTPDTVVKESPQIWLQKSLEWIRENVVKPFGE
jgi:hypothetical protein